MFFKRLLIAFRLAGRNILRSPRRTGLTLIAAILGVSSTVALAGLARGMGKQIIESSIYNLTGHIKIQHPSFEKDPAIEHSFVASAAQLEALRQIEEIRSIAPRLRALGVIQSERDSRALTLVGVDPEAEEGISLAGQSMFQGRGLEGVKDKQLILGAKALSELETKLNRRVVILTQDEENELESKGLRVAGIYKAEVQATERQFAFLGIETMRAFLKMKGDTYHEISLQLDDDLSLEVIKNRVQMIFPEQSVKTWKELQPLVVSMVKLQNGFLIIWFCIVIISVGFGVVNSLLMSIFERVRELAVMNALGMTREWIIVETLIQSFLLLLLGGLLGAAAGAGIISYFSGGIDLSEFARGASVIGVGSTVVPIQSLSDLVLILGLLVSIGTLGCLYPAWHAAQVKPSRALQRL